MNVEDPTPGGAGVTYTYHWTASKPKRRVNWWYWAFVAELVAHYFYMYTHHLLYIANGNVVFK